MLPLPMQEVVTSVLRFNGVPFGDYAHSDSNDGSPAGRLYQLACEYESWAAHTDGLNAGERAADASAFASAAKACAEHIQQGSDQALEQARVAVAACKALSDLRQYAARAPQAGSRPPVVLARHSPRPASRDRF